MEHRNFEPQAPPPFSAGRWLSPGRWFAFALGLPFAFACAFAFALASTFSLPLPLYFPSHWIANIAVYYGLATHTLPGWGAWVGPVPGASGSSLRVGSNTRHERRVVRLLRRGGSARHLDLSTLGLGGWPEPSSGMPYPPRACRRIRTLESAAPRPPCGGPWSPPPPRSPWLRTFLCLCLLTCLCLCACRCL